MKQIEATASRVGSVKVDSVMTKEIVEALPVYDVKNYDTKKKELTFTVKASPRKSCWRLVHDGKVAIDLFESSGLTETAHELICGTYEEVVGEAKKIGLESAPVPFNFEKPLIGVPTNMVLKK